MQNKAEEKLRIIDTIKENASMIIIIVGVIWAIVQTIIIPLKSLEFGQNDILNNHLKTIQDEMIVATQERKVQGEKIDALNSQLVRLETILEQESDKKILNNTR